MSRSGGCRRARGEQRCGRGEPPRAGCAWLACAVPQHGRTPPTEQAQGFRRISDKMATHGRRWSSVFSWTYVQESGQVVALVWCQRRFVQGHDLEAVDNEDPAVADFEDTFNHFPLDR